jgi:hypothetical protein
VIYPPGEEERIAEIRARTAAASPGPWFHVDDHHGHQIHAPRLGIPRAVVHLGADAAFIAAAREDVEFLLGQLEIWRKRAIGLATGNAVPSEDM